MHKIKLSRCIRQEIIIELPGEFHKYHSPDSAYKNADNEESKWKTVKEAPFDERWELIEQD